MIEFGNGERIVFKESIIRRIWVRKIVRKLGGGYSGWGEYKWKERKGGLWGDFIR